MDHSLQAQRLIPIELRWVGANPLLGYIHLLWALYSVISLEMCSAILYLAICLSFIRLPLNNIP